ncbi:MAG TPA: hypothetical protein DEF88_08885 [Porphyromonadaceae bacterium]|nr:hypothetical protein [Porphyromonadaceae bacterium]
MKTIDNARFDRERFRRNKYEYGEIRDAFPEKIQELLDSSFDLLSPFIEIIHPARSELREALIEHTLKQYPELDVPGKPWLTRYIIDITDMAANSIASDIFRELQHISEGQPYNPPEKYERYVTFYARPRVPKLKTKEDFRFLKDIPDEVLTQWVEEDNQEEIEACEYLNGLKSAFIEVVQPTLFKYFKASLDELDAEGWNRYGIAVGAAFECYREDCDDLCYYLEKGCLDDDSGLDFYHFAIQMQHEQNEKYMSPANK